MTAKFRPDRNEYHYRELYRALQNCPRNGYDSNDFSHARGIFDPEERAIRLAAMRRANRLIGRASTG